MHIENGDYHCAKLVPSNLFKREENMSTSEDKTKKNPAKKTISLNKGKSVAHDGMYAGPPPSTAQAASDPKATSLRKICPTCGRPL
jgi:protoporphyrinogen oxidase